MAQVEHVQRLVEQTGRVGGCELAQRHHLETSNADLLGEFAKRCFLVQTRKREHFGSCRVVSTKPGARPLELHRATEVVDQVQANERSISGWDGPQ